MGNSVLAGPCNRRAVCSCSSTTAKAQTDLGRMGGAAGVFTNQWVFLQLLHAVVSHIAYGRGFRETTQQHPLFASVVQLLATKSCKITCWGWLALKVRMLSACTVGLGLRWSKTVKHKQSVDCC